MADELHNLSADGNRGGWKTFPYIAGGLSGVSIASSTVLANIMVYLIQQYNLSGVTATQINNVVSGCVCVVPMIAAIVADSGVGPFFVTSVSTVLCLVGMLLFTLTACISNLRPNPCRPPSPCESPTLGQLTILFLATALFVFGFGGTRYTAMTLGANQFNDAGDRARLFNWCFVVTYVSAVVGHTAVVYLQDNLGWCWGFSLCTAMTIFSILFYIGGCKFFRHVNPQDNPFSGLWSAIVSARRKRTNKAELFIPTYDYCVLEEGDIIHNSQIPSETSSLFSNLIASEVKIVEDLDAVITLVPIISTALLVWASVVLQGSLSTLQALAMDRHIGDSFVIPAGSITVFRLIACAISILLLDHTVFPAWQKTYGHPPSPLTRIGLGYILNTISLVVSAAVECIRLKDMETDSTVQMSVKWLAPSLFLAGLGEALHFPGAVAFYYQQFPTSLRSSSTGMVGLTAGVGTFMSTAIVALVERFTNWMEDGVNESRLDYLYWLLALLGAVNCAYFLVCVRLYKP